MGVPLSPMGAAQATGHIKGFDGLRAFSILLVVITHLGILAHMPDTPFFRHRVLAIISGGTGVNIFFTLSGFLITRLLLREQARKGAIHFRSFYARRFLRLTPPFTLFILILLAGMAFDLYSVKPVGLIVSFFYLYNYIPQFLLSGWLSHTWSLAVEEQFYLVWPFLITLLPRRRLAMVAFGAIMLSVFAAYVLHRISFHHGGHAYALREVFMVSRWFFPAAGPIMVGALVAVLAFHRPMAVSAFALKAYALALSVALFLSPLYLPGAMLRAAFVIQAAGVALLLLIVMERQRSLLTRMLDLPPIAYLGKISYGVYLYHVLVISTGPASALVKSVPLGILLFMGLSIASYELYEKPILKLKERFH